MSPFPFSFRSRPRISARAPAPQPDSLGRHLLQRHLAGETALEIASDLDLDTGEVRRAILDTLRLVEGIED